MRYARINLVRCGSAIRGRMKRRRQVRESRRGCVECRAFSIRRLESQSSTMFPSPRRSRVRCHRFRSTTVGAKSAPVTISLSVGLPACAVDGEIESSRGGGGGVTMASVNGVDVSPAGVTTLISLVPTRATSFAAIIAASLVGERSVVVRSELSMRTTEPGTMAPTFGMVCCLQE